MTPSVIRSVARSHDRESPEASCERTRVEPLVAQAREQLGGDGDDPEPTRGDTAMSAATSAGCSLGCGAFVLVIVAGFLQIAHWLGL